MRKITILIIAFLIICVGVLSGCTSTDDRPDCTLCSGRGYFQYTNAIGQTVTETCPRCGGTGKQG